MKNILYITATLLMFSFSQAAFAQGNRIVPVQAGTAHISNGSCTITLNEPVAADNYFVAITPQGETAGLYITKSDKGFVVKERPGRHTTANLAFDFVVYQSIPVQPATTRFKPFTPPAGK